MLSKFFLYFVRYEKEDFISGLNHGVSIIDGSHG